MLQNSLIKKIESLQKADKYFLYTLLKGEVGEMTQDFIKALNGKETASVRAKAYARLMQSLTGADIFSERRTFPIPHCRMIVAAQLVNDGYTTIDIGEALGKNHSTIIYYRNTMEAIINTPKSDPKIYAIWANFQNHIQNETTNTSTIGNPATV